MLASLLPPEVAVEEVFGDPEDAVLLPGEEAVVARAVEKRRLEYTTTRHLARVALGRLGLPPVAILTGGNREPLWPAGIVGSMTHCRGYRAAAVARGGGGGGVGRVGDVGRVVGGGFVGPVTGIGIDAEPHGPLPQGVFDTIARPDEMPGLAALAAERPQVRWDRLVFSAKESVYKAWFPVARRWLGFGEASVEFVPAAEGMSGTFSARILQSGAPITRMTGRWTIESGLVLTAVTV
ncbi:4'-phosphopantetheinyl transferase [Catenulispora acidiphila DSM 44928]|uniref:4'-phosphopantetheinyl transferase n=1 Tax=Catenulispora acidiphila (strain DSM 44928 / JCM 14897 / NBRC 102108 / NRRL B-24433 / ID139908) TaxID=479433 RepID=C7QE85_CATAD|nr:4'-phosphopantetheinyl transferase superfamily protein [Catenulispora acidiphila]ACU70776.1 4'-phosphopantetheinyl transferase [Catenulispora acidiphila DSM 44928]